MARKNGSPNYVEFQYDREVTVTLCENRGALRSNDMGDYFLRHFQDELFSCCSPELERRILDVGAKAGSVVSIRKERYGRSAVWVVKLLGASQNHQNGHATVNGALPQKPNGVDHAWNDLPSEKYAASPADGDLVAKLAESVAMVQAERNQTPASVLSVAPASDDLLTRCLTSAISAVKAAEAYALSVGYAVKFEADQVQALASTLYIQSSKQTNINLMHRNEELRNGRAR